MSLRAGSRMSCAEVMYQPYAPYFPYQRSPATSAAAVGAGSSPVTSLGPIPLTATPPQPTADFRKFGAPKMNDPVEQAASEFPLSRASASDCSKEKAEAQYLSANCVVFTYYSGDISSVVDEHFSRALSQPSSYTSDGTKGHMKDCPPMSHRNFPPSFWNSNYQSSSTSVSGSLGAMASISHQDLSSYSNDPYHTGALHASLHHQSDPWHYTLPGQSSGHFAHHRSSVHDLSYPGVSSVSAAGARFSPQYGSLLLQPSAVRSARITAACAGLDKSTESWGTARYHEPISHNLSHMDSNYATPYGGMTAAMTGLENQVQDSKDLYWF